MRMRRKTDKVIPFGACFSWYDYEQVVQTFLPSIPACSSCDTYQSLLQGYWRRMSES